MLGYLNWISFLGYDFQSYPNSQKISLNILAYPYISYHILSYSKISSGANSKKITPANWDSTNQEHMIVTADFPLKLPGSKDVFSIYGKFQKYNGSKRPSFLTKR
jgi:hypothetical protein